MTTKTVRVPEQVHSEIQSAAEFMGLTPAELIERAWSSYRQSAEFHEDFTLAQRALMEGDTEAVLKRLQERREQRASRRAASARKHKTS